MIAVFTFGFVFTRRLEITGAGDAMFTVKVTVPLADKVCDDDGVIEVRVKPDGGVQERFFVPTGWLVKLPGPVTETPFNEQDTDGTVPLVVMTTVPVAATTEAVQTLLAVLPLASVPVT